VASSRRNLTVLILGALALGGCSAQWGWYVISPATESGKTNLLFLLGGLKYTIALSLSAIVISMAFTVYLLVGMAVKARQGGTPEIAAPPEGDGALTPEAVRAELTGREAP